MDKLIRIKKGEQELHVYEKAFRVVYASKGYQKVGEVEEREQTDVDYYELSAEELKKVKNDDLKAFLDKEKIEYASNATKDDLIALITGE